MLAVLVRLEENRYHQEGQGGGVRAERMTEVDELTHRRGIEERGIEGYEHRVI